MASAGIGGDAAAGEEAAYSRWRRQVGLMFPELDLIARTEVPVAGRMRATRCGAVKMAELSGTGHLIDRRREQIRRSPSEHPYFCWQRAEPLRIVHEGGTDELRTGGFVIHDSNRPHQLHMDRPFDLVCVQLPDAVLRERSGVSGRGWTGALVGFTAPVTRIVTATMTALTETHATPEDAATVGDLFLEVVGRGLAAQGRVERGSNPVLARRAQQLERFVEARFRQEGLSPADAAAELGCSLRLVHVTAATMGTSFGKMLLEARLQAALVSLKRRAGGPVGEVAYSVGFSDLSHFSRAFRARFGTPPSLVSIQG